MGGVIPVLHNVYSVEVVRQFAKVVYGLGFKIAVISKPSGAAAQAGVPEAQRIALKRGRTLVVLSGIEDVIELFAPSLILMVMPKRYAKEPFDVKKVVKEVESGRSVAIVFGGSEPGLTAKEMSLGLPVHLDVDDDLGALGFSAIALYKISSSLRSGVEGS